MRERLLPALEAEARARLAADAREAALADAGDRLWELAKQAPLHVRAPRASHTAQNAFKLGSAGLCRLLALAPAQVARAMLPGVRRCWLMCLKYE